jgi:glutamate racemase
MAESISASAPVGVFDSGIGGLSVLREIHKQLPSENIIYVGDQGHVPYGPRPMDEVRRFSFEVTRYLLERGSKIIVIACNTASAAALSELRAARPDIHFIGMEPAVKPAAEQTHSGVVGVLATPATFQGALYASVVERFAKGVTILQSTCPGLVNQIEKGELDTPETRRILENAILPMLEKKIDTIVMGCTHYPFVIPLIQQITGPEVRVIDPAPAIARQTQRILTELKLLNPGLAAGKLQFLTSGNAALLENLVRQLTQLSGTISGVTWDGYELRDV